MELTAASKELFESLAKDAPNWSGEPLLDKMTPQLKGNLTHLKTAGLLETITEDRNCVFVIFTDKGRKLAAEMGYQI